MSPDQPNPWTRNGDFFGSLRFRVLVPLIVALPCLIGLGLVSQALSADLLVANSRTDLQAVTRILTNALAGAGLDLTDSSALGEWSRRQMAGANTRLTLIRDDGLVLADTEAEAAAMENHADRPEFRSAMEQGSGWSLRPSATLGSTYLYAALRLGSVVVRLSRPAALVYELQKRQEVGILVGTALAAILLLVSGWRTWRGIMRPLDRMRNLALNVVAGGNPMDLVGALEVRRPVELAVIAHTISDLTARLAGELSRSEADGRAVEQLLDSLPDGVFVLDSFHIIKRANRAALDLLNRLERDLIFGGALPVGAPVAAAVSPLGTPILGWIRSSELAGFLESASGDPATATISVLGTRTWRLRVCRRRLPPDRSTPGQDWLLVLYPPDTSP